MIHQEGHRTDRRINVLLALTFVVTAGILIFAVFALPAIFSSRNNTSEVIKGNEMAACRAQYAGQVNRAMGQVLSTKAELDLLFALGLQASVLGNDARTRELATQVPEASTKVAEAVAQHRVALARQQAANDLSRTDPDKFLEQCENGA